MQSLQMTLITTVKVIRPFQCYICFPQMSVGMIFCWYFCFFAYIINRKIDWWMIFWGEDGIFSNHLFFAWIFKLLSYLVKPRMKLIWGSLKYKLIILITWFTWPIICQIKFSFVMFFLLFNLIIYSGQNKNRLNWLGRTQSLQNTIIRLFVQTFTTSLYQTKVSDFANVMNKG